MHPEWAAYLRVFLALHITCGVVAFFCAPIALGTVKGGRVHRRWGKVYFWAMAGVAVTALILSFAVPVFFLAMVAVLVRHREPRAQHCSETIFDACSAYRWRTSILQVSAQPRQACLPPL